MNNIPETGLGSIEFVKRLELYWGYQKKEMVIGDGIKQYNGMDNGDCNTKPDDENYFEQSCLETLKHQWTCDRFGTHWKERQPCQDMWKQNMCKKK